MLPIQRLAKHRVTITCALATAAALLVMIHIGWQLVNYYGDGQLLGPLMRFHLDKERNIPTLFSTLLLLSAAALLFHIRHHERMQRSRDAAKWTVLAIGFLYIAIDEFGHIHELLIRPGQELLGDRSLGLFYYTWVIPAIAILLVLAVYFLGFLLRLPARTRMAFIIGGTLFVGGSIGFEMLEGRHDELHGERNLTYMAYVTIEEALEMTGVIVFINALLHYIDQHIPVRSAHATPGPSLATAPRVQASVAAAASMERLDPRC